MVIDIDAVQQHPMNGRVGNIPAIMASLKRFGQQKPIVVQASTGNIIAGNHTWQAAKQLGWDKIDAVYSEVSDEDALAYLIADNRTSDLATYNKRSLLATLQEVGALEGTGFESSDVDDLEAETDTGTVVDDLDGIEPEFRTDHIDGREEFKGTKSGEPMRDVVLMMPASKAAEFGEKIKRLQAVLGTRNVVDTVHRVVDDAVAALPTVDVEPEVEVPA